MLVDHKPAVYAWMRLKLEGKLMHAAASSSLQWKECLISFRQDVLYDILLEVDVRLTVSERCVWVMQLIEIPMHGIAGCAEPWT